MRRRQLEHASETACQIIGHKAVIVMGSQAILGTYAETQLPDFLTARSIAPQGRTLGPDSRHGYGSADRPR